MLHVRGDPVSEHRHTSSCSSSPGWKAPTVLRLISAAFLRLPETPSPFRRPPEPRDDMELEELGSFSPRGVWTPGKEGRLYGTMSSEAEQTQRAHKQQRLFTWNSTQCSFNIIEYRLIHPRSVPKFIHPYW